MGFNPVELLESLLGPRPTEPWSALIPQILLWCFRRFCIQKLIDSEGALSESLWEDHLQLVFMYCPKGLESTSLDWMTPENMGSMHSSSEKYNEFFIKFVNHFDQIIEAEDYAAQDELSEFLDTRICEIIYEWLDDSPFAIFPTDANEDDAFTDEKFQKLIDSLLSHANSHTKIISEKVEKPEESPVQKEESPVQKEESPVQKEEPPVQKEETPSLLWQYLSMPPMLPPSFMPHTYVHKQYNEFTSLPHISVTYHDSHTKDAEDAPDAPGPDAPDADAPHAPGPDAPDADAPDAPAPSISVARAMAYRRTLRKSRNISTSRVKTRKSHPAP